MREVEGEKPIIPVLGRPMIDRVLDAVQAVKGVVEICVSVSLNTPQTEQHLRELGVDVFVTDGKGYSEDLNQVMSHLTADLILVLPADVPLITPRLIEEVFHRAAAVRVGSFCVTVPVETMRSLDLHLTYSLEVEGREVVLCGISVVDREAMLTGEELDQDYMVSEAVEIALNVNTKGDLERAEGFLSRRLQRDAGT